MSLQVCTICGWSKVTTYQGLRIHQGKKGCTPKGLHIPRNEQFTLPRYRPLTPLVESPIYRNDPVKDGLKSSTRPVDETNKSLQVCTICGWSKVTSYQGLRTHQGMKGCTPKGLRIPRNEQFTLPRYQHVTPLVEPPIYRNDPIRDGLKYSTRPVDETNRSLQVCTICGWSKVTSYQGLRTHQGKKGCTPKGLRIPRNEQFTPPSYRPVTTLVEIPINLNDPIKDGLKSSTRPVDETNRSLQVCDTCGWSKVTSYQGLRTHQGKNGCTPKGLRISRNEQCTLPSYRPATPLVEPPIYRNDPIRDGLKYSTRLVDETNMSLQVCNTCGWSKVTTYQGLRTHQGKKGCTPKGLHIPRNDQCTLPRYQPVTPLVEPSIYLNDPIWEELKYSTRPVDETNRSLQVCEICGWSKVTSYQGLRIHQGMKGCTPKGLRIPRNEQFTLKGYRPATPLVGPPINRSDLIRDRLNRLMHEL